MLPHLACDLLAGRPAQHYPGLCFRDASNVPVAVEMRAPDDGRLERVPLPNYDESLERLASVGFRNDIGHLISIPYEGSRGCWWGEKAHCKFCGLNGSTMAFRSKPGDQVLGNWRTLAQRHRRLAFHMVDNIIDPEYLRTLLPELCKSGVDFELSTRPRRTRLASRYSRPSGGGNRHPARVKDLHADAEIDEEGNHGFPEHSAS